MSYHGGEKPCPPFVRVRSHKLLGRELIMVMLLEWITFRSSFDSQYRRLGRRVQAILKCARQEEETPYF